MIYPKVTKRRIPMTKFNSRLLSIAMGSALSFVLLTTPSAAISASFGPQSSTKAQEWGFDFVETFDGLQDWNQSARGRVGNQWDSSLPDAMPKLANGSTSAWGYYSMWGDGTVSTHSWIGSTAGGRQVWRGTKSASIDIGETAHGPSRLGLFMGSGYRNWSFFYMVYIPKNNFPTFCAAPGCSSNGIGSYTEGDPYIYWAAYKFHSFNMGCYSSHCPVSNTYGLQDSLTMIKHRNYAPVGVSFVHYNGDTHTAGYATDAGNSLNSMFGDWFGVEVKLENSTDNTTYKVNMWVYDQQGRSTHMMRDYVTTINADAQSSNWDQFFFGGNNSLSWQWGPTMSSHYYIDDFIIDDGSKGQIGPRYFNAIGVTTAPALAAPPPDFSGTPRPR